MSDTPSPSGSDTCAVIPAKRKWTSKMMKTWVGTDPSTTAPEVHHGDKRSAARAERKKKLMKERDAAARAPPTYRLIRAPFRPQEPEPVPSLDLNSLISFDDDGTKEEVIDDTSVPTEPNRAGSQEDHSPNIQHHEVDGMGRPNEGTSSGETDDNAGRAENDTAQKMAQAGNEEVDVEMAQPDLDVVRNDLRDSLKESTCNSAHPTVGIEGKEHADDAEQATHAVEPSSGLESDYKTATAKHSTVEQPASRSPTQQDRHTPTSVATVDIDMDRAASPRPNRDITSPLPPAAVSKEAPARPPRTSCIASQSNNAPSTTASDVASSTGITPNADAELPVEDIEAPKDEDGADGGGGFGDKDGDRKPDDPADFNVGWRRFGPQGQDISDYVPRYPDAPKVHWPTRLITSSPFIPDLRRGKSGRNRLKWDQTYVANVAKKFKSSRERPDLCVHATFTTLEAAFELIDACNAHGKPLVLDEFPESVQWAHAANTVDDDPFMEPVRWSTDRLRGVVGANLLTPRDFQDATLREVRPLQPYVTATLLDFHSWLKMPGKVRCILDLTCGFTQRDNVTEKIADNVLESFSSTFGNKYSGHFTVVADMMKTLDWFLLHTAGFLTFGHIDASGMATSAEIRGAGMKEWVVFSATKMPQAKEGDSRSERRRMQAQLVQRIALLIKAASTDTLEPPKTSKGPRDWEVDGCIIELRPGMKYYQPAGTVHAAYTPVPTAAAGKHYFTYSDLHRMELSRRVQMTNKRLTNHNHNCGVQLMLITMAAALPIRAASGQVFYRKPMIAMALMLTRPQDYIPEPKALAPVPDVPLNEGSLSAKERAQAMDNKAKNAERLAEFDMTQRLRDEKWAEKGTAFDRLAYTVAMNILLACKTKYPGDSSAELPGSEYIFEGGRWDDPGPPLDVRELTDDLRNTHVDDLLNEGGESDTGRKSDSSESELTDLE